jgi:hypothetical protein
LAEIGPLTIREGPAAKFLKKIALFGLKKNGALS